MTDLNKLVRMMPAGQTWIIVEANSGNPIKNRGKS